MSEIRPFRGLRYTGAAEPRIAPPYDVIVDAERDRLAEEPENIVHLTLPPGPSEHRDYASAARLLREWIERKVLARDAEESLYVLEETTVDGRVRRGFLAAVRLAQYSERVILPHERTMRGPKQDRLLLTREVRANLEPLFFLYEDRENALRELWTSPLVQRPLVVCKGPDGTALKLWADSDPGRLASVRAHLQERSLIIADGHHRYETMVAYRDECRAAGASAGDAGPEFVMAYLVNAFDPGSRVQAIHRLLYGDVANPDEVLRGAGFGIEELPGTPTGAELVTRLAQGPLERCRFAFVRPGGSAFLAHRARDKQLDVEVLHAELLPALGGELDFDAQPDRLVEELRAREATLGILLHPIEPEALFRVVEAGAILPQKSTYFAPKIPTGLVLRTFE